MNTIKWDNKAFFIEASKPVFVPLIEKNIDIVVDPEYGEISQTQRNALGRFLQIQEDTLTEISISVHQNMIEVSEFAGEEPLQLENPNEIWKYVDFTQILVPVHENTKYRYIFLQAECDWEPEHGLELLFKNEKLLKVGQQEGLSSNQEWWLYYINK